ncbi:MAG TPA: histidine--tRNA ligase [Candidatus Acidoferrales bacterium]|nr:histidine--tRNA ligase [Candidatus Acidoferrales bacterium]
MSEGAGKAHEKLPGSSPEKRKIQAIKGVRDILPPETALWNRVEQTAHEVFATYGFGEIRLPIFEATELFARSIGKDTDIVSKEMYTFEAHTDRLIEVFSEMRRIVVTEGTGSKNPMFENLEDEFREESKRGSSLTLRPEATASVCRAYIEHGMHTLPGNVKLYYMGPMFRRERPQKGRYRQFYQIGAEVLSQSDDLKSLARIDAELIEMLLAFFEKTGLEGTTLYLNSIGCKDCRPKYVELLRAELTKVKDKLGPDSQRRIETNPLRVLDSKLESEQAIIEKLPRIADHLCGPCREQYAEVKQQLALRNIKYQENWRLVRGLDYYVRTTFEITAPGLGSQNAVCGGGRYDGLVEQLGGPDTKGIGFSIGTDRLILSLQDMRKLPLERSLDVFVAWMGEKTYPAAVKIARRLRDAGVAVELPPGEMKFGKALGLADKLGARYALIIGEDELASGQFTVKRLADGEQKKLREVELVDYLKEQSE